MADVLEKFSILLISESRCELLVHGTQCELLGWVFSILLTLQDGMSLRV